jgi:hypothetical protein
VPIVERLTMGDGYKRKSETPTAVKERPPARRIITRDFFKSTEVKHKKAD